MNEKKQETKNEVGQIQRKPKPTLWLAHARPSYEQVKKEIKRTMGVEIY